MKTSPTFWLTTLILVLIVFITVGVIIFMTIPKEGRQKYRYLGALLCVWSGHEIISSTGYHLLHLHMNLLTNVVEFIFVFVIVMMYKEFIQEKKVTMIAYMAIGCHWIFGIINLFFWQGPFASNGYTWALSNIIIVSFCLYYFYFLIKHLPLQTSLKNVPTFWINLAMLITHVGTFFVYIFEDYLVDSMNSNFIIPSYFHVIFAMIFQPIAWYALSMIRTEYRNQIIST